MLPDSTDASAAEPLIEPPPLPPLPPREPFWDYVDLALVIGYLFLSLLLIGGGVLVSFAFYPKLRTDPTPLLWPTQLALYVFVYLTFRVVLTMRHKKPVLASLGWRSANFNPVIAAIGGGLLAFAVSAVASVLHTPKVPSPIDKLTDSPLSLALFGVLAVTIAPFFEELFFRGFLQPLLSRSFGVVAGVLLTAFLFGALHAPEYAWAWQYVVAVSLAGAVFGWIRARTNSIIPSTIMHGCYNAVFIIALAISKYKT